MPSIAEITIVVPTRNEADNIAAFVDSLPAGVQLIVVDHSDDATVATIHRHRPLSSGAKRCAPSAASICGSRATRTRSSSGGSSVTASIVRCSLLYTGLMPERWRASDWGYWKGFDSRA